MKKITMLMALLMTIASLAGCTTGGNDTAAATSQQSSDASSTQTTDNSSAPAANVKDTVVIRVESPWGTFNPMESSLYVEFYEINQMYEALTWADDNGEIVPVLAESWDINEEGNEYIFHLRQGVKFHNGEELKASDVVFTFTQALGSPVLNSYLGPTKTVEAIGDYDVKLTMEAPFAPLLAFIPNVRIVNEKFYNENNGDLRINTCGTGPYKLVDVDMNAYCKMTAFEDYWKGEAAIKNINFTVISDDTTSAVSFMANEVNFISTTSSQYLEISTYPDKYSFKAIPTKHTALIYLNMERAPFDNPTVRKAIQHAVDREALIMVAFDGFAAPAYLQGDESCFGVDYSHVQYYEYDLEKAKALLAEAGYPDGLDLGQIITTSGSYMEKCAVVLQSSLAEIGCKVEIRAMENTAMTDMTLAGDYGIMTGGQSFSSDFAYAERQYCSSYIGSNNYSRIRNDRIDEIFALAKVETSPEKRKELYGEAIEIITDIGANIPMFHKNLLFAWSKDLNVVVHPDSAMPYFVYNWAWQ